MLKHIISLVFLSLYLSYLPALSDTNFKVLPKEKPKVLLNKNIKKVSAILPKKKPNINIKKSVSSSLLLPKEKPINKKVLKNINNSNEKLLKVKKDKEIKSKKVLTEENIISNNLNNQFIFPEKKTCNLHKYNFKSS